MSPFPLLPCILVSPIGSHAAPSNLVCDLVEYILLLALPVILVIIYRRFLLDYSIVSVVCISVRAGASHMILFHVVVVIINYLKWELTRLLL